MSSQTAKEDMIHTINSELRSAYLAEEYWKQRSRQSWLTLGDKNSGYFHAITRERRAINIFSFIEDEKGNIYHEEPQIVNIVFDYFQKLYTTSPAESEEIVSQAIIHRRSIE